MGQVKLVLAATPADLLVYLAMGHGAAAMAARVLELAGLEESDEGVFAIWTLL